MEVHMFSNSVDGDMMALSNDKDGGNLPPAEGGGSWEYANPVKLDEISHEYSAEMADKIKSDLESQGFHVFGI